jgi:hypothetical protein
MISFYVDPCTLIITNARTFLLVCTLPILLFFFLLINDFIFLYNISFNSCQGSLCSILLDHLKDKQDKRESPTDKWTIKVCDSFQKEFTCRRFPYENLTSRTINSCVTGMSIDL